MKQSHRIKIAVRGKEEADALYQLLTTREECYKDFFPDFLSAVGPQRRKGTHDLYDLHITIPNFNHIKHRDKKP
jgi:hypothetical protein